MELLYDTRKFKILFYENTYHFITKNTYSCYDRPYDIIMKLIKYDDLKQKNLLNPSYSFYIQEEAIHNYDTLVKYLEKSEKNKELKQSEIKNEFNYILNKHHDKFNFYGPCFYYNPIQKN